MRIAFTHNLQQAETEEQAEFDTSATVAFITDALVSLGHKVESVEVSGPASRLVARLEAIAPDLVFNTAEGTHGRFREAFFPALFERLGLPFTGSDAYVCAVTLDKALTKRIVAAAGVPVPGGAVVRKARDLDRLAGLSWPRIVKPNHEGSSKGIDADSVVEDATAQRLRVEMILARYPDGVLVEEFITGQDIVVPFLEGSSRRTGGVLDAVGYVFDPVAVAGAKRPIYDYDLKVVRPEAVTVQVPADLSPEARAAVMKHARTAFEALGVRDLGRIDFRVDADGKPWFIEVNALPSLEKGASLYAAAAAVGLDGPPAVLGQVLRSAAARQGFRVTTRPLRRRSAVRVGLTYNLKRGKSDAEAEHDTRDTIDVLSEAIASLGHEVVELEATDELPSLLPHAAIDVVFNIAEGWAGRHRESEVPALLELLRIPYTGSDPACCAVTLDKALAKRVVLAAGLPTAPFLVMRTGAERLPRGFSLPAFVKPLHEGSSKGIESGNVVESEADLRARVRDLIERFRQPVLVEEFLVGREFTTGLLGERKPRVLPPMEIVFLDPDEQHPYYSASKKENCAVRSETAPELTPREERAIRRVARGAFLALGCRDVARIDLRMDAAGRPCFVECNPLPGMAPNYSDLCAIADGVGMDYRTLVGEVLAPALRRMREQRRVGTGR